MAHARMLFFASLTALVVCASLLQTTASAADAPIAKKAELSGAYMLQNKATGLMLRPAEASFADGTPMVLFPKKPWDCLTYTFRPTASGGFVLENHYTHKTFQPTEKGAAQIKLQSGANEGKNPSWIVEPVGEKESLGFYLKDPKSGKVLSAPAGDAKENAPLVLAKPEAKDTQLWLPVRREKP